MILLPLSILGCLILLFLLRVPKEAKKKKEDAKPEAFKVITITVPISSDHISETKVEKK